MNQNRLPRLPGQVGDWARSVSLCWALTCALAVCAGPLAGSVLAQAGRGSPAPAAAVGLDSLSEDAVMSEVSGLKLDSLLNRMFETDHIPREKQESIKALGALRELGSNQPISNNRRLYLVNRAVSGLNALLPTMTDPILLMTYTGQLIDKGIVPDMNILEYWGETPALQARVKPAADIASKMLDQVATQSEAQQQQLTQVGFHGANDPNADKWVKLDELKGQAKYVQNMIAYYRAMAIDTSGGMNKAAVAERAKICDTASKFLLDPYDQPGADGGNVQPVVHNRLGMLAMAKGDYTAAKAYFNAMIIGKTPDGKDIDPKPVLSQIYEARYFSVLCDVLNKRPDIAEKGLSDLLVWEKSTLPAESQSGADADASMLRYRMLSAKADLAKNDAEKEELNKQSDAVLVALEKSHPEFTSLITEQLVNHLPETAKLEEQGISVLQALIGKGKAELLKPENVPLDEKVAKRAVAAARVFITRREITPREKQDTTLLIPMILDRLPDPVDAANGYLDYAKEYAVDPNAGQSVDHAAYLAYQLAHGPQKDDPPVKMLYDRALSTAVSPPWSRKELAYYYAEHLRSTSKPRDAIAFYKQVPAGDKNEFSARFFELVAINAELDDAKLAPVQRQKDIADAGALVDELRKLAPGVPQNDVNKFRLAQSTILGANFAIEGKQPVKALQLLANFDAEASALKQGEQLLQQATQYRAKAYIANKQFDKATAQVLDLAKKSPDAAQRLAKDLLDQLGKDYDRQKENGLTAEMSETATNQALLTDFMVSFCEKSSDPRIMALTPDYQLYDAKMKLNAGNLAATEADRKQKFGVALAAYLKVKQAKPDDTTAAYGVGLCQFALGDWPGASATLGTLLKDGKLGGPTVYVTDKTTGEQRADDNTAYWEATYKWIKSNYEQSKGLPNDPTMKEILASAKQSLKDDFVNFGDSIGGAKWASQYQDLRKELIPDYDPHGGGPSSNPSTSPTAAPTSQPVAGARAG